MTTSISCGAKNLGIDKQAEVVTDRMLSSHISGKKIENIQKLQ